MKTLYDLADWAEALPAKIETAAKDAAVFATIAMVRDLALNTPVDTSEALSNWIVSLGNPAYNVIRPHRPGHFGSTAALSANATISAAQTVLQTKRYGQPIYLANNAPHIELLNNGWSQQAPSGFADAAFVRGRMALANYRINTSNWGLG